MAKRIKLKEGDLFILPLRTNGYLVGLVARIAGNGVPMGYFFNDLLPEISSSPNIDKLTADNVLLVSKFGIQGFADGTWRRAETLPGFTREDWPVPIFLEKHSVLAPRLEFYSDDMEFIGYGHVSQDTDLNSYYESGTSGSVAIEIELTKILGD
jgi:hypothetical protein